MNVQALKYNSVSSERLPKEEGIFPIKLFEVKLIPVTLLLFTNTPYQVETGAAVNQFV